MTQAGTSAVPDFEALASAGVRRLRAYDPGLDLEELRLRFAGQGLVELGSNENAYGASPLAMQAVRDCLGNLHRYPDPRAGRLKRAVSIALGVSSESILAGNGSHELLMLLAQVFAGPGRAVLASQFGFAVYALAAQAAGARFDLAPALPASAAMPRGHDLDALAAAIGPDTALVYLANPNNPTATWFEGEAFARFLSRLPASVLVVVDEAYLEYATEPGLVSAIGWLDRHPNLVVTRTFSKAYGLAGLRVGIACAHPALVAIVERVRESFNVSLPGQAAAAAALGDAGHLRRVRIDTASERDWLAEQLRARDLVVGPSQTNFLLVDLGRPAGELESALVARAVVPRPMAGYGLPQCLRITVGRRQDNLALLTALDEAWP